MLSVLNVPFTVSVFACMSPSMRGLPEELSESIIIITFIGESETGIITNNYISLSSCYTASQSLSQ